MKVVILCGGLGSRLSEETSVKPKPMVKIGKTPILLHIIKYYEKFGYNEFIIALGYKGYVIKKFFKSKKYKSKIHLVDTGKKTLTGGRVKKLKKLLKNEKEFMLTYGDGLANVNLVKLLKFHRKHKKIATVTAVHPPVRFGELEINLKKPTVKKFQEKVQAKLGWINGGFFIFKKEVLELFKKNEMLERGPLQKLTKSKNLVAYKHYGFWQCMDTLRDKILLEKMYKKNKMTWLK
tara:strand:+ start:3106 stop:3810 length:705 start_codon:yes stop_codon:yes gene_type:complete